MITVLDYYESHINLAEFDVIVGPAYGALAIATGLSLRLKKPMMIVRKEIKDYGTGGQIIGELIPGKKVLLVDDVLTSGASLKTISETLTEAGYHVVSALVLIDRRAWNQRTVCLNSIKVRAVMTIEQVLKNLCQYPPVIDNHLEAIRLVLENQDWFPSLEQRSADLNLHFQVKRLLSFMIQKQSRLILSADISDPIKLLELVAKVGSEIVGVKIHTDCLNFNQDCQSEIFFYHLNGLKSQFKFVVIEDRKLADIGNTTVSQLKNMEHADLITAHLISGPGVIEACAKCDSKKGLLLIAQMSSSGNLISPAYTREVVRLAQENPKVVAGLICQEPLLDGRFLHMTPGVHTDNDSDDMGQKYRRPAQIDTDLFIVGRSILEAPDPLRVFPSYKSVPREELDPVIMARKNRLWS